MADTILKTDFKNKRLLEQLVSIKNLPPIPSVVMEVSALLDDPKASASQLGKIINRDQSLVIKVLTIANSPLYGLPRKVSTIEFAIVILGFDHIKNIIVALSMMEAFKSKNHPKWNRKKFWEHCFTTAILTKRISGDLGYSKTGEAFTAGLLHDLGISVMQRYFPEKFDKVIEDVEKNQVRYLNAEKRILGITHCEIGEFLIRSWNLPNSLADAVLYHAAPSEAPQNRVLASLVHLADYMTMIFENSSFDWDENIELDLTIIDALSLGDINYLRSFIESYKDLFTKHLENINNI